MVELSEPGAVRALDLGPSLSVRPVFEDFGTVNDGPDLGSPERLEAGLDKASA